MPSFEVDLEHEILEANFKPSLERNLKRNTVSGARLENENRSWHVSAAQKFLVVVVGSSQTVSALQFPNTWLISTPA